MWRGESSSTNQLLGLPMGTVKERRSSEGGPGATRRGGPALRPPTGPRLPVHDTRRRRPGRTSVQHQAAASAARDRGLSWTRSGRHRVSPTPPPGCHGLRTATREPGRSHGTHRPSPCRPSQSGIRSRSPRSRSHASQPQTGKSSSAHRPNLTNSPGKSVNTTVIGAPPGPWD